ncbi:MAG TPA: hypothetical protein ENJ45_04260 [Phaeodactylibacter sp.]|nr:hypothetical protein [Phaeodactylibacter sp.]
MQFYRAVNNAQKYLAACSAFAKKEIKKDPIRLHQLAETMLKDFPKEKKVTSLAESFAKKAVRKNASYQHYNTYAQLLLKNGKKEEALAAANKCLELAKEKSREEAAAQRLIKIIKG